MHLAMAYDHSRKDPSAQVRGKDEITEKSASRVSKSSACMTDTDRAKAEDREQSRGWRRERQLRTREKQRWIYT